MKTHKLPGKDGRYRIRVDKDVWQKLATFDKHTPDRAICRLFKMPVEAYFETRGRPRGDKTPMVIAIFPATWQALCKRAVAYESPAATLRRELGLPPIPPRKRPRKVTNNT